MDTSPEYIEMCKKAQEIQTQWNPDYGDYTVFYSPLLTPIEDDHNKYIHNIIGFCENSIEEQSNGVIWLPRQDQLMQIIEHKYNLNINSKYKTGLYRVFAENYRKNGDFIYYYGKSLEIALLNLIMGLEYNKTWNKENKKWISI